MGNEIDTASDTSSSTGITVADSNDISPVSRTSGKSNASKSQMTQQAPFHSFVDTVESIGLLSTLDSYKSTEFNGLLDEILKEVDDYKQQKESATDVIPPHNVVPAIGGLFAYIRQLGNGASGRVCKMRHHSNQQLYGVKELNKNSKYSGRIFLKEVKLLKKLAHPHILNYFDCFMDNSAYYIATDYCSGGTLLDKIIRMAPFFSEKKASEYIRIILGAVSYMHSLNIVHRDLKAQNVVFDREGLGGCLKIIDFGDSKIIQPDRIYSEFVGTIHYVPPEVIRPRSGVELKKGDLWSIGVITYLLVVGMPPFNGRTHREILQNIQRSQSRKLKYPKNSVLTKSAKDFIEKLLCFDVEKRLSAADALKHEWICCDSASTANLSGDYLSSLKKFNYGNKLQRVLVNAILSEMDDDEQSMVENGILTLNNEQSNMDGNSICDYLLLYSPVEELPHHKERMDSNLTYAMSQHEDATGTFAIVDDDGGEDDATAHLDNFTYLDNFVNDMDDILQEIDMDINDDDDDKQTKIPKNTQRAKSLSPIADDDDDGLPSTMLLQKSASVDLVDKRISVSRFHAIMDRSQKKYAVDEIVNDLAEDGFISLDDIQHYQKDVDTMRHDDISVLVEAVKAESNTSDIYK
eukprot:CAMPEP_0202689094 /NCGR_PEP_ID=MMETSP1385-20130828/4437_1 /ASSEMBLY_ACC=CAM_ASM_000861 /TAXON_ID=933848 /ORGANISM="Elphidium margaritaceum" /LENGTH=633 /DNA_ID=CAMNT_0049344181 /DNA_START=36 /DNA_END=1937 /DNA_ORIENTATION=+